VGPNGAAPIVISRGNMQLVRPGGVPLERLPVRGVGEPTQSFSLCGEAPGRQNAVANERQHALPNVHSVRPVVHGTDGMGEHCDVLAPVGRNGRHPPQTT